MMATIQSYEPWIRMGVFATVLVIMALWELHSPRRRPALSRLLRWPGNLGIVVVDAVTVRLVFPTAAVAFALSAQQHGWGLFNALTVPAWFAVAASVIMLDLIIYLQHVLFHAVPVLWRVHRMHHTDLEFDVSTGLRFHPVEILLSLIIKFAAIAVLGPPAIAVLAFEVLLNASSMFNHGNVDIPRPLDRVLRWLVVTPDMHRVHHSIHRNETNSNFGFNLPWWDRLFGTYRDQPRAGHETMTIGIKQFRAPSELRLDRLLLQPLRGPTGGYAINRNEDTR